MKKVPPLNKRWLQNMTKYQVDTNVLLRFLTNDIPTDAKMAREFFKSVKSHKLEAEIGEPVFIETLVVLRNYYKYPKDKTLKLMQSILALDWLTIENLSVLTLALDLYSQFDLDFVDCLILARSKIKQQKIFSFDAKLAEIANL